ncbi:MAG TPA: serine hydrolase domain-containing protein [Flavobacteriales bacterium]|nr:serine hydrolase domain-containing protein [Flavobacteriales bacterium]
MRHTTLLLATNALLLLACAQAPPPEEAVTTDPLHDRIDSFLLRSQEAGFNGSVVVMRDGKALLDKGYGLRDREKSLPNTPATVHAIGSITKQFTAAAIMKLEEQGKLSTSDLMSKYVPNVPADKKAITLHHLLTHSAGFPDAIGDDYEAIDRTAFLQRAMAAPLVFAPGSDYRYTNVGYSILGAIVELVSGMGYEQFLSEQLLKPAGMMNTGYKLPDWGNSEMAIGYAKDGTRWGTMLDHPWANDGPYWNLRCNGGILSTTHDMSTWVDALRTNKVLSAASTTKLFTPYVEEGPGSGSHYGYGWALFKTPRSTRLITHNGGNGIQFADVLWYADEGITIVLLSNANIRGMQDIAWEVAHMIFDPSYQPRVAAVPQPLVGIPQGPTGERMKAFSSILASSGDEDELKTWLHANLGPGFLSDMPMEQHLEVFKELCSDIGANTIVSAEQMNPEEFTLHLVSAKNKRRFRVMMQLRPSDARISGLGVEKE